MVIKYIDVNRILSSMSNIREMPKLMTECPMNTTTKENEELFAVSHIVFNMQL